MPHLPLGNLEYAADSVRWGQPDLPQIVKLEPSDERAHQKKSLVSWPLESSSSRAVRSLIAGLTSMRSRCRLRWRSACGRRSALSLGLRPHLRDPATRVNMPETHDVLPARTDDRRASIEEPRGHLLQAKIAGCQAEEMAPLESRQLLRAIADLLVLRKQDPSTAAALGDPPLIRNVGGVLRIELRDQMHNPAMVTKEPG